MTAKSKTRDTTPKPRRQTARVEQEPVVVLAEETPPVADEFEMVDATEVPAMQRSPRAAGPLRAALVALAEGKALKIRRKDTSKPKATESSRLYSAARSAGVKISVTVDDEFAYVTKAKDKAA